LLENSAVDVFLRTLYVELHKELQTIVNDNEFLTKEAAGAPGGAPEISTARIVG
jgi:hypothetical protein